MASLTSTSTGSRRRPDPPASSEEVSFSAALARTNTEDVPKLAIHDNPHETQDPKPHDLQGPDAANKEVTKHHVLSSRPLPKDQVELLESQNQLKNANCIDGDKDDDHDNALLSNANSTDVDVDELIQLQLKFNQQQQQQQREPDRLVFVDDQHVSPSDIEFNSTTAMTFKEVKTVAKELDEQDKQTKDLASAVHEREPFPHEEFGQGATQSTGLAVHREHGHTKQPFPRPQVVKLPIRPCGHLYSPQDPDYHGDYDGGKGNGDIESSEYKHPGGGDHRDEDIEQSLIQAHLVTTQEDGDPRNIPKAEIVKTEAVLARYTPTTAGSKFLCFAVLVLLAGVVSVGIVCGSGNCLTNHDGHDETSVNTMSGIDSIGTSANIPSATTEMPTITATTTFAPSPPSPTKAQTISVLGKSVSTTKTEIDFSSNGLKGTLPTEIGCFTSLTSLELSNNMISGTIPSELGLLTQLTYLGLHLNQVSGSIPHELGLLTKLAYLVLGDNQLSGIIPSSELGLLTNLAELRLRNNKLWGTIPSMLGLLTQLTFLDLSYNNLLGTIPSQLGLVTKLSIFSPGVNQFFGPIPSQLGLLTELHDLYLETNQLTGTIPSVLSLLTQLTGLSFHANQLSGTIPSQLGMLTELLSLTVYYNDLSGTIPSELGLLTQMTYLGLHMNQLGGEVPSTVCGLSSLSISVDIEDVTCPPGCASNCG